LQPRPGRLRRHLALVDTLHDLRSSSTPVGRTPVTITPPADRKAATRPWRYLPGWNVAWSQTRRRPRSGTAGPDRRPVRLAARAPSRSRVRPPPRRQLRSPLRRRCVLSPAEVAVDAELAGQLGQRGHAVEVGLCVVCRGSAAALLRDLGVHRALADGHLHCGVGGDRRGEPPSFEDSDLAASRCSSRALVMPTMPAPTTRTSAPSASPIWLGRRALSMVSTRGRRVCWCRLAPLVLR
jgi:hypothetical protein